MRSGNFAKRGQGCCTLHRKICPHLHVESLRVPASLHQTMLNVFIRSCERQRPQTKCKAATLPCSRWFRHLDAAHLGQIALLCRHPGVAKVPKVCGLATSPRKPSNTKRSARGPGIKEAKTSTSSVDKARVLQPGPLCRCPRQAGQ